MSSPGHRIPQPWWIISFNGIRPRPPCCRQWTLILKESDYILLLSYIFWWFILTKSFFSQFSWSDGLTLRQRSVVPSWLPVSSAGSRYALRCTTDCLKTTLYTNIRGVFKADCFTLHYSLKLPCGPWQECKQSRYTTLHYLPSKNHPKSYIYL